MQVQNLKLSQKPAIYCLYHCGNDTIIPAKWFSDNVKT